MRQFLSRGRLFLCLLPGLMLACSLLTPASPVAPSLPADTQTIPTAAEAQPGADTTYRYDDLPDPINESAAFSKYRAITAWNKTDITYVFVNGTDQLDGDIERDLIRRAFALWSEQTVLTFTEVADRPRADIVIGWATGDHGDGDPFDGPGDVLAHASFPNPYDNGQVFLHFDDDERWVDSETRNVDLLTVAAHEIGHTLGLAHSSDPNALMFASYGGPRRFLGEDDIQGIQAIYGVGNAPNPGPEVPSQGEAPPPGAGQDTDGDGISDSDEVLVTHTDPNNPDSDADGLVDGVEVVNHMNPLDPDMDRDGVSDGQEVQQGTNPFFPEQADVPPELEEQVSEFLTRAIELQIDAYRRGDASIASSIMTGPMLESLSLEINALNQQGLVSISEIDYYNSYIFDIRVINNALLEVDTCEVWSTYTYRLSDGRLIDSQDPMLLPQTVTIERINGGWFITTVEFFDPPAFCT